MTDQSITGFLNVLKPRGLSSHDVVQRVRRISNARVGHTGTLDPAATGVLILAVGPATRLCQYILDHDKTYRAEFTFGVTTDTLDAEGTVTDQLPCSHITEHDVQNALAQLVGEIQMVPPAHSAVHINGRRAYELAREGIAVDVPVRTVTIHHIQLIDFQPGLQPVADIDVHCSTGTYIRSLAAMVGDILECPAYMSALTRTTVGEHSINRAITLDDLARDGVGPYLISPAAALSALPHQTVTDNEAAMLRAGQRIPPRACYTIGQLIRLLTAEGQLVAVGEYRTDADDAYIQPRRVLPPR